ncbi:hypothetical protein ABH991_008281 [Bradyrhizobium ottawaense]|uniref:Creatininase family protein n=1 Tax=Bradyrhizobium ottawaense TaxID=931866 RepID=A0ABV4FII6_9BRAD
MSIEVEWARMTAPELREIAAPKEALAILPAGSLEQHGPHLPVITDTASAASVAAARLVAADSNPVPVAVLPGLWLGLSEHHLPFGGAISVDYVAYRAILEGIVRSLRALGFSRLLIVNGHGGNIDPLAVSEVSPSTLSVISSLSGPRSARSTSNSTMRACSAGNNSFHSSSNPRSASRTSFSLTSLRCLRTARQV